MEAVTDFIFLGSKIFGIGDYRHKIKRCLLLGRKAMTNLDNTLKNNKKKKKKRHLLLGRKAMTNLDSILKSRDITWLTKSYIFKAMVFPVVMYACES